MKEGRSAYIKSNNPHLTGGEKHGSRTQRHQAMAMHNSEAVEGLIFCKMVRTLQHAAPKADQGSILPCTVLHSSSFTGLLHLAIHFSQHTRCIQMRCRCVVFCWKMLGSRTGIPDGDVRRQGPLQPGAAPAAARRLRGPAAGAASGASAASHVASLSGPGGEGTVAPENDGSHGEVAELSELLGWVLMLRAKN